MVVVGGGGGEVVGGIILQPGARMESVSVIELFLRVESHSTRLKVKERKNIRKLKTKMEKEEKDANQTTLRQGLVKTIAPTYKVRYSGVVLSDKWPIRRY